MKSSVLSIPQLSRRFWLLAEVSLIGILAGIIFQVLDEKTFDYRSVLVGFSTGFSFWFFELFVLSKWRKRILTLPLILAILIKAVLYLLVIYTLINTIGLVIGYFEGKQLNDFYNSLVDREQIILYGYILVLYVLFSFHRQLNLLLGEGILIKFLLGKYRKPTKEHRIFMFLDLKSSTSIAERLGHIRYYSFLNDFFHEISAPVKATSAEIYQYVGDEIVFTWKTKVGLTNNNCLRLFFKIKDRVVERQQYYLNKYGAVPAFKAGMHFGEVITAQIGDIKREIVYNGDVLNTSARIQEQCNRVGHEFLISGLLLEELNLGPEYAEEKIQSLQLRGKESLTSLYSITE
ncbi:MAG: adenylate/guanylate cyclase domain-containing protein [Roseivirga sp.]|nr:adenylate/guanylate cyclase domain-containing protein [Roseivirga sp.]